jgi:2'-5' RNA ligase
MTQLSAIDIHVEWLDEMLEPWRRANVEVANHGMPPHVTLLYPWRVAPLSEKDAEAVRKVLGRQSLFEIRFAELSHFGKRVLYLALDKDSEKAVKQVMQTLFRAFPETPPHGGQFADPTPHLTVAKAKSDEHFEQLMNEILERLEPKFPIKHFVDKVSIVQQDPTGFWRLHSEVLLE